MKLKTLYLVVGYGHAPVIKAAKRCDIKVIELQHGIVTSNHMGYGYPFNSAIERLVPDYFCTWGGVYAPKTPIYGGYTKVLSDTVNFNTDLRFKKCNYYCEKKAYSLYISQGVIGNSFFEYIYYNLNYFNKNILIKLHPGEFDRYKRYSYYQKLKDSNGVEFVEKGDIVKLVYCSSNVIGVFSTVLLAL